MISKQQNAANKKKRKKEFTTKKYSMVGTSTNNTTQQCSVNNIYFQNLFIDSYNLCPTSVTLIHKPH